MDDNTIQALAYIFNIDTGDTFKPCNIHEKTAQVFRHKDFTVPDLDDLIQDFIKSI